MVKSFAETAVQTACFYRISIMELKRRGMRPVLPVQVPFAYGGFLLMPVQRMEQLELLKRGLLMNYLQFPKDLSSVTKEEVTSPCEISGK